MAKILLVEDDLPLARTVKGWLSLEHHSVETVHNGLQALDTLAVYEYDLIILDWQLPELSGLEVCKQFRARGGLTPILMLTGKSAIAEKEAGLDAGSDDYLTKPFHMKELSARVRAMLRRAARLTSNVLSAGKLTLDPSNYRVTVNGEEILLQKREFALLEFLMRNPNKVFSAEALLERVWASETDATSYAIRTCMMRLRKKIDSDPESSLIETIKGVGYRLNKV